MHPRRTATLRGRTCTARGGFGDEGSEMGVTDDQTDEVLVAIDGGPHRRRRRTHLTLAGVGGVAVLSVIALAAFRPADEPQTVQTAAVPAADIAAVTPTTIDGTSTSTSRTSPASTTLPTEAPPISSTAPIAIPGPTTTIPLVPDPPPVPDTEPPAWMPPTPIVRDVPPSGTGWSEMWDHTYVTPDGITFGSWGDYTPPDYRGDVRVLSPDFIWYSDENDSIIGWVKRDDVLRGPGPWSEADGLLIYGPDLSTPIGSVREWGNPGSGVYVPYAG
jgi:hypothetical protein